MLNFLMDRLHAKAEHHMHCFNLILIMKCVSLFCHLTEQSREIKWLV